VSDLAADKPSPSERRAARFARSHGAIRLLAVGVNDYPSSAGFPSLKKCVNDAGQIDATFREVRQLNAHPDHLVLVTSATIARMPSRGIILDEVRRLAYSASEADRLMFYFSGHGHRIAGVDDHFLVPQDVYSDSEPDALVSMRHVMELLQESTARQTLIVLDACLSGPTLLGRKLSAARFSPRFFNDYVASTRGFAVLSSSSSDEASFEQSPNPKLSLFTHYLNQALRGDPGALDDSVLTLASLYDFLSTHVRRDGKSRGFRQTPSLASSVSGVLVLADFSLHPTTQGALEVLVRGVSHLVLRDSQSEQTKNILTSWSNRALTPEQLEYAANTPQALGAYLTDTISTLRPKLRNVFRFAHSEVEADHDALLFPGGSLSFRYRAETRDRGKIHRTLTLDSDWFADWERLNSLLALFDITSKGFRLQLLNKTRPLDHLTVLEAHGWDTRKESDEGITVAKSGVAMTLTRGAAAFQGLTVKDLFAASSAPGSANDLLAEALNLIVPPAP
jgi:hypothetical protein